jgi:hypothetical protein
VFPGFPSNNKILQSILWSKVQLLGDFIDFQL